MSEKTYKELLIPAKPGFQAVVGGLSELKYFYDLVKTNKTHCLTDDEEYNKRFMANVLDFHDYLEREDLFENISMNEYSADSQEELDVEFERLKGVIKERFDTIRKYIES